MVRVILNAGTVSGDEDVIALDVDLVAQPATPIHPAKHKTRAQLARMSSSSMTGRTNEWYPLRVTTQRDGECEVYATQVTDVLR